MAALAIAAVGAAISAQQSHQASKQRRKANSLREEKVGIENSRQRKAAAARQRELRARSRAAAIASGTGGGSSEAGVGNSLITDTNSGLSNQLNLTRLDSERFNAVRKADKFGNNAQTAGAVSSFATGNAGAINNLFSGG